MSHRGIKPGEITAKDAATCTFDDTLDWKKLQNDGSEGVNDACLENNRFEQMPDFNMVNVEDEKGPVTEIFTDLNNVTWYANGFQWKPTSSGEIFNTYDFMIAVGKDLQKKFPAGSLVRINYEGRSVMAKVVDRKPESGNAAPHLKNRTLDLSKATAYALGGYGLLQRGIIHPITLESVRLNGTYNLERQPAHVLGHVTEKNYGLSLKTALFKFTPYKKKVNSPLPKEYDKILAFYWNVVPETNRLARQISMLYFFSGLSYPPLPQLTLVQQYPRREIYNAKTKKNDVIADTAHYIDFRVVGFLGEEDRELFKSVFEGKNPKENPEEITREWETVTSEGRIGAIQVPTPYHDNDPTKLESTGREYGRTKKKTTPPAKKVAAPPPKTRSKGTPKTKTPPAPQKKAPGKKH